jgi:type VI secretion system protein ImpK
MTAPGSARPLSAQPDGAASRRGQLALTLQEAFTAISRLRANRQVAADADAFRASMRQVLSSADQEAQRQGYAAEDVRFALFAVIAFLDETVLNSGQPMFSEWPRRPLQEEIFGVHMAGELFFQYLQQLLGKQDSDDLADVLEVFELCLLLGFKGRFSATRGSDLQVITAQVGQKIDRVHGALGDLSPRWRASPQEFGTKRDPWVPRLAAAAIGAFALALVLFIVFSISLRSNEAGLRAQTAQLTR